MYIIKIIKYQLYLLQLENYELGRYFKLLFKKGFWPRGEQRKSLVWTSKAKALFLMAMGLHLLIIIGLMFWSYIAAILVGLILLTTYCLLFAFALLLLWPVDFLLKQIVIVRAKSKILNLKSQIKIIGIAGSYGKTTMKEVLRTVLSVKHKVLSTPESVNTPVGISRWILKNVDATAEILIVEMGEHYKGDIGELCKITPPDIAVVTGVNEAHLERMGSIERIVDTIFEVATNLKEGGYLYLNGNNQQVVKNFQNYIWKNYTVKQFSTEHILNKNFDVENLCWSGEANGINFKVKLLGEYGLAFVDAAMQVAALLDMPLEDIKKGVEAIKPVEHRLQPIRSAGNMLVIDDAYNGNPDGVREAIKVLSRFSAKGGSASGGTNRRKVFITPGLVEIGKASAEVHRQIGKELAGVADVVVLIKNSVTPWIEQGIKSGLPTTHYPLPTILWFETAQQAHTSLSTILKPGDVVVFQNDWGDQYI